MGLISEKQLEQALAAQRDTGERLGEILIARGYATRLAIQDALAEQRGLLLKPDPGFGGGLRSELVRRETRPELSGDQRWSESRRAEADLGQEVPEANTATFEPEPRLGQRDQTELELELERLGAELSQHEQRLGELERELEKSRRGLAEALRGLPSKGVAAPVQYGADASWAADNLSDPFLVTVSRARKHLTARRAELRQRNNLAARP